MSATKPTAAAKTEATENEFALGEVAGKHPDRDFALQKRLVAALYGTPKTILWGSASVTTVFILVWLLSADVIYAGMAGMKLLVSAGRIGFHKYYEAHKDSAKTVADLEVFERLAMIGAWSNGAVIGFCGGYTALAHGDQRIAVLIGAVAAGYAAGLGGRNASKPEITIGQSICTSAPFVLGLMLSMSSENAILAILLSLNCFMTWSSALGVYKTFLKQHYAERDLHKHAHYDELTGLMNRKSFLDELDKRTEADEAFTLISIDLDHFKHINDTMGHDVGDELLEAAADRIVDKIRDDDVAARVGGDEFLVITQTADPLAAREIAIRLLGALGEPFMIQGVPLKPGASIGYAIRKRGTSAKEFMKNVDLALYSAKEQGRSQVHGYDEVLKARYDEKIALEQDLAGAIGTSQLEMHYQPIVDPSTGEVRLAEALMRWRHPKRGMVSPATFIPMAESTGQIVRLGQWTLEAACAEAATWKHGASVSVNISPLQFGKNCSITNDVRKALMKSGLQASRLTLEVTEGAVIEDVDHVIETLKELRKMGVKIAMDDFGTGHSSLSMLSQLPLDKLKVDRSFVRDLGKGPTSKAIMSSIAHIAKQMRLELIVEGVETVEQRDQVMAYGVQGIQGYLYAKPMGRRELRAWFDARARQQDDEDQDAA